MGKNSNNDKNLDTPSNTEGTTPPVDGTPTTDNASAFTSERMTLTGHSYQTAEGKTTWTFDGSWWANAASKEAADVAVTFNGEAKPVNTDANEKSVKMAELQSSSKQVVYHHGVPFFSAVRAKRSALKPSTAKTPRAANPVNVYKRTVKEHAASIASMVQMAGLLGLSPEAIQKARDLYAAEEATLKVAADEWTLAHPKVDASEDDASEDDASEDDASEDDASEKAS